jgi:hypothetical protein
MLRWAVCLVLAGSSAGCIGPLVQVTKVDETTAAELDSTIPVYEARDTPQRATVLGPVTATSCKNKMWDPAATSENATAQLRLLARQRGGTAVGNLVCENQEGTSLAKNCWESVTCTGTAIKVAAEVPAKRR